MRRAGLLALTLALLSGCYGTSLRHVAPGEALRKDRVVLVGSLRTVPGVTQRSYAMSTLLLPGPTAGNFFAFFTTDLSEPWKGANPYPLERYESAWLPFDGHFFVEVPAGKRLYLRGVRYVTDRGGWEGFELPMELDVSGARGVVYVGELQLSRLSPISMTARRDVERTRSEAKARGLTQLLEAPWQTRLLRPVSAGELEL